MSLGPHVELGMYPFDSVAWAWDELWAAVHRRAPWLPVELSRSGDVHARWYDPDCLVTHVCGAPFIALHQGDMRLIGAFEIDIDDAEPPGHYHSVLLSPHDTTLDRLVGDRAHVVANSAESLSGWLSLLAATVGPLQPWPGEVTFTAAHVDSIRTIAKGEGDLAAVDSWSLAFVTAEEPELVDGLHRVGIGPRVPTPALVVRKGLGADRAAEVKSAVIGALDDPATAEARRALHIAGFADNTLDDYRAIRHLIPS